MGLAQRGARPGSPPAGAHRALGETLYWLGEFALAREHQEQEDQLLLIFNSIALMLSFMLGLTPGCIARCFAALALWHLGYPDQAINKINEALALAQELSHSHSLVFASSFATWLHQLRRDQRLTLEWAGTVIALSTEQGFPVWLVYGTILQGWALAQQRQEEEGIAEYAPGLGRRSGHRGRARTVV